MTHWTADCPHVRPLRSRISLRASGAARSQYKYASYGPHIRAGQPAAYSNPAHMCAWRAWACQAGGNRVCTASQITGETRFPESPDVPTLATPACPLLTTAAVL